MTVHADIGGLIWVVIVIASVIGQIVKGARKVSAQAPGKGNAPTARQTEGSASEGTRQQTGSPDPAEALQDFFRSLSGQPTPPPRLLPPELIQQRKARKDLLKRQQEQRRHTKTLTHPTPTAPVLTPAEPADYQESNAHDQGTDQVILATGFPQHGSAHTATGEHSLAHILRQELSSRDTARKAMILREILGPPLALR
ncbi:MAG TPA: hypothetical protein DCS43_00180 [Verrucomicrobia bacterium]|nr:hypothetical protein [Verrucomicrobiota bacterium]